MSVKMKWLDDALMIAALMTVFLIVLTSCTTARQPPWIIEQPLHYAPPEPAPAGPKPPPARQERRTSIPEAIDNHCI
jgi:hypothetical protein